MNRVLRAAMAASVVVTVLVAGGIAGAGQQAKSDKMATMNAIKPFSQEAFKAAMAEGKTTLVFFHAPWCPVCKAQEPKIQALLNGDYAHVTAFRIDYDSNVALRREMKVDKQSTLILYRGMTELARLSYTSEDAEIARLFSHARMM